MTFRFRARVVAGSRREAINFKDGIIKVYVAPPPSRGKANKRVKELLSDLLNIKKSNVEIISGLTSNRKMIVVSGIKEEEFWKTIRKLG